MSAENALTISCAQSGMQLGSHIRTVYAAGRTVAKCYGATDAEALEIAERLASCATLAEKLAAAEETKRACLASEHALSNAFLRLRGILGAWKTPYAPTDEQIQKHVEDRALELVARVRDLEAVIEPFAKFSRHILPGDDERYVASRRDPAQSRHGRMVIVTVGDFRAAARALAATPAQPPAADGKGPVSP